MPEFTDNAAGASVDPAEIERFAALAADWWNPRGPMRALHRINPLRLSVIREAIAERFDRSATALDGLTGLTVVDIGCGAGLLSEPLARLGASVTGIDAAEATIEAARGHAALSGLAVDYRCTTAESLAESGARFDLVMGLEIIEHVQDPESFVATLARLARPGGLVMLSTINRTLRAFGLAIIGAEYLLGWVPKGTHQFEKFVRPGEIEAYAAAAGLVPLEATGLVYNPVLDEWRRSRDTAVNYMIALGA
jgi:2-polyprenyl-6-hydroxyphenyl methylase / 3-demethylubiquinone-9 3-methyltransferase